MKTMVCWVTRFCKINVAAVGLCSLAFATLSSAGEIAITGEGGLFSVQADNYMHGRYAEPACDCELVVSFKQARRMSADPIFIAKGSIILDADGAGDDAVAFEVGEHHEEDLRSTAHYKVALNLVDGEHVRPPKVELGSRIDLRFRTYVDERTFPSIIEGTLLFAQLWQGSPYAPPVSLQIKNYNHRNEAGVPYVYLVLADEQNGASKSSPGKPIYHKLTALNFESWMDWRLVVELDPFTSNGKVEVYLADEPLIALGSVNVGYNRAAAFFRSRKPTATLPAIELMLYRKQGLPFQRMLFNDIHLIVTESSPNL